VGADEVGAKLKGTLAREGIDIRSLRECRRCPSGAAFIAIDERGENQIVVSPGSNAKVTPERIQAAKLRIKKAGLVLLQREIPPASVAAAVDLAAAFGVPVVLNPAPGGPVPHRLLRRTDVVVLNETEAEILLGKRISGQRGVEAAVSTLATWVGGGTVVLTLGGKGACLRIPTRVRPVFLPAHPVRVVDTTGAGDAFVGAFAAQYLESRDPLRAAHYAMGAAALCVGRLGAIPSIPRRREVERFLNRT
jgi:ribokinase